MGIKTKFALATAFVGVATMAAAAFGAGGSSTAQSNEPTAQSSTDAPGLQRPGPAGRRGQRRDADRCSARAGARPRAMRLVHRESTYQAPDGSATVTLDQGKITKVDGKTITIERLDGKSVSATASDETKVCKDGEPSTLSALKVGDHARLAQVRSAKVTGLRRVVAFTPKSDANKASPSGFSGEDFGDLTGGLLGGHVERAPG